MIPPITTQRLHPKNRAGFSLVEVTLAIGIVAFAFVALFGLVPTGLNVFRAAIDTSIGSTILQQVVENAQQADYDGLVSQANASADPNASRTGALPDSFYDAQGDLVLKLDGTPLTADDQEPVSKARAVYRVHVKVVIPTKVPAATQDVGTAYTNNVATLAVRIAKDPGHIQQPFADANKANVSNYIAYVSRNKASL